MVMHQVQRPNILLYSVDDMNDWAGCLDGYPGVQTPNLDRFAAESVLFTNAHCPSPLCNPSRTAILTGWSPDHSGVYTNQHWWRPAHPEITTLPMHMRENGYHVAGVGKVFHHTPGFNPPDQWDEYSPLVFDDPWDREAYPEVADRPRPPNHPLSGITPFVHEFDWGVLDKAESEYGDQRAVRWASEFLGQDHDKPFFLAVGTFRPHLPWYAPKRYFERYPLNNIRVPEIADSDLEELPVPAQELAAHRREDFERVLDHGKWEEAVQGYLAAISFGDELFGSVLDALDSSRYAENTIVVFYSDNGFHVGEKRHWHKSTLWERGTHVPFVIRPPRADAARTRDDATRVPSTGRTDSGGGDDIRSHGTASSRQRPALSRRWRPATVGRSVSLQDIYPTICDLCGIQEPESGLDGRSLAPLLADPQHGWDHPAVTTFLPGNAAVRSEEWRYIRYRDGGEELYNRREDPLEEHNRAGELALRSVKGELSRYLPAGSVPPVPSKSHYAFDADSYSWTIRERSE